MRKCVFLASIFLIGCGLRTHEDVRIFSFHAWASGGAKSCSILTGRAVISGESESGDPQKMWCFDDTKAFEGVPPYNTYVYDGHKDFPYEIVAAVRLDRTSEKEFDDSSKWAVSVVCTRNPKPSFLAYGSSGVSASPDLSF